MYNRPFSTAALLACHGKKNTGVETIITNVSHLGEPGSAGSLALLFGTLGTEPSLARFVAAVLFMQRQVKVSAVKNIYTMTVKSKQMECAVLFFFFGISGCSFLGNETRSSETVFCP